MLDANTISIIAGATSIVLAFLAIVLMIWFFILSKNSEAKVSNSLTKIETQAESLQRLSGRWMDRLTKYVTTEKPSIIEPAITNMFTQLPQAIIQIISQVQTKQSGEITLTSEQFNIAAISIYFYSAQTNYWSQKFLPLISEFDENNPNHTLIKRIIDTSHQDFQTIHQALLKTNQDELSKCKIYNIYLETKNDLAPYVHSVSEIFVLREKKENVKTD